MEYFACGFAVALFVVSLLIYFVIHNKDQKKKTPEKKVILPEPEKDCFLIIFDRKHKILRAPKYCHDIQGPMAIDVYQWITGNKIEEDNSYDTNN